MACQDRLGTNVKCTWTQLKLTGSAGDSTFVCGSQAVAKALATAAASRARSAKNNHLAVFAYHFDALRALACDPYQVRNATVCAIYYKPIILPNRLGTNMGKLKKRVAFRIGSVRRYPRY
jgi:hypothetical protein